MRIGAGLFAVVMAWTVCLPAAGANPRLAAERDGQSLSLSGVDAAPVPAAQAHSNLAPNDPATRLCADGTRAIDQGRWADAVKIFSQVAGQRGDHADGALYWKAYAENKLGQARAAGNSCKALRSNYPKSRWVEDCGALEVELQARNGDRVRIDPGQSDDVKLLALNAMMRQNEARALVEIQEILKGDSSEKLKQEAQFILGNHYSDTTWPQAVRISRVEGDVRIQRGGPEGKPGGAVWEQAVSGVPVQTGFSIATGAGRAEIEFENASTMYLGENSVLTFNDLHETAGVPYTEMGLLSGTVSLYFRPCTAWEKMVLHTPTSDLVSRYPDRTYARVEAFTDALAITPLAGGDVRLTGVPRDAALPGHTFTWLQGVLQDPEGTENKGAPSAWDTWVAGRVAERARAVASVMEASGLAAPIPGMADMAGQGRFFDCAPYGTCWEPNDEAEEDESGAVQPPPALPERALMQLASYSPGGQAAQAAAAAQPELAELEYRFPCTPVSLLYRMAKDPATGRMRVVSGPFPQAAPWDWAVCHAGSWIRYRHRKHYVWVAGGKRRHVDPVRWVRSGRQVGFVPLHPYDVKGQPALNARHGFFAVSGKGQVEVRPVRAEAAHPIEFLKAPPREYATALLRPLAAAETPRMEARAFPRADVAKSGPLAAASLPIRFDPRTQSFLVAHQQVAGGRSTTVYAPMTNHSGSLQARAAGFGGSSGFHGGGSGGGSHGGGTSTGGSGGGSHGGASVSSASSASSASIGGSHH